MTKFTICTPWLPPRPIRPAIDLINAQTYQDWEHLITIDRLDHAPVETDDPRRRFIPCEVEHNTWGNTCRHNMWEEATGDWIMYLDDDDRLYPNALEEVAKAIEKSPESEWGYFIIKLGPNEFFHYPPAGGGITGGQIFHRKYAHNGEELRWFDNANYGGDWDHIYQHFVKPDRKPILLKKCLGELPKHGRGTI